MVISIMLFLSIIYYTFKSFIFRVFLLAIFTFLNRLGFTIGWLIISFALRKSTIKNVQ